MSKNWNFRKKKFKNPKISKKFERKFKILEEIAKTESIIRKFDYINQQYLYVKVYQCSGTANFEHKKRMILLTVSTLSGFYCIIPFYLLMQKPQYGELFVLYKILITLTVTR